MHYKIKQIIEEMETCYPSAWAKNSSVQKAKVIGKLFNAQEVIWQFKLRKAKEREEAAAKQLKEEKKKVAERNFHKKWHNIIMKAEAYYGDMCYEYAIQLWGDDGPEMMCSGAKELSASQEEECMSEALYAAHAINHIDNPKFYNQAIAYWKKYHR